MDAAGAAYVTGETSSADFPTANALQPRNGGGSDAFVAKLSPAGSALVYATYLGGSGGDLSTSVAVDAAGAAYVRGQTTSADFPTANPLQPHYGGGDYDTFVAKISDASTPPPDTSPTPTSGSLSVDVSRVTDDHNRVMYFPGAHDESSSVDGNALMAMVHIVNNGSAAATGSVVLSVDDVGIASSTQSVTVASGHSADVPVTFPSDGLAWEGGHVVTLHKVDADFNAVFSPSVFVDILPRPLVMVHGLNADDTTWEAWYKPEGYLQQAGYPASVVNQDGLGVHYGYPVDTLNTKNSPTDDTRKNAQELGQYIDMVRGATGADKVDLVAHSMGGLISRSYIATYMPGRVVTRLIMLGTPNMGSNAATLGEAGTVAATLGFGLAGGLLGLYFAPEPATDQNTPHYVQGVTNHAATDRKGVHYFAIGGNIPDSSPGCFDLDSGPSSDEVVSTAHMRELSKDAPSWAGTEQLNDQQFKGMEVTHIGAIGLGPVMLPNTCHATIGAETGSQAVFDAVKGQLADASLAAPAPASSGQTRAASVGAADAATTGTATSPITSPVMASRAASLAPGQAMSLTVSAAALTDLLGLVMVGADQSGVPPALTLTASNGAVSTADAPQAGTQYIDTGGARPFPFRGFDVQAPQDGAWTLTVTNPATSGQTLPVVAEFATSSATGLLLSAGTDQPSYLPGQTITATAALTQVDASGTTQPVVGQATTVTAQLVPILNNGFAPQTVTLYDDGAHGDGAASDGVYGASFPAPDATGSYVLSVTAAGAAVQRMAQVPLQVRPLTPPVEPDIALSPYAAPAGALIGITSTACFSANEHVAVTMGSVSLGTASVDQTGALSVTETVPAGISGEVPITVTGQSSGVVATAPFAVLVADQSVTPTVTPSTTPSLTATNTPPPTGTNTSTATATATATRTATPSATSTSTPTPTSTPTSTTNTAVPTSVPPPMATPLPPSPPPTSPPPTPVAPAPTNTAAPPVNPPAATATTAPSGSAGVATQGPAATATAMPQTGRPASTPTTGANRPVPVQPTDTPAPQIVSTSPSQAKPAGKPKPARIVVDVSVPGGTMTEISAITVSGGARSYNTVDIAADLSTTTFVNQKTVIYVRPGAIGATGKAGSKTRPRTRPDAKPQPACRKGVRGCVARTVTRRVARTTRLYRTTARTRADRTGRFKATVRLRYRARKTLQATLTVTVRTAQGQSARHLPIKIVPPPIMHKSTGKAGKPRKR